MAGRLTRFLNLERPRRPGEMPQHEVATAGRFTGSPSGMALQPDVGEQPFVRCPRCEADNSRYAERCSNCQAPLDGDDVRAWNEKLWADRQAQLAQEGAAVAQARTEGDVLAQNRMLGEALAREVGERERARLSWWRWSGGLQDPTPIGVRLLAMLPTMRARIIGGAVAAAAFVGALVLAFESRGHPRLQGTGFAVAVLLLLLFAPNVPRSRRWWW
jgi:hypothetical protein